MKQIVEQALGINIGEPTVFKNLTIFPLTGGPGTAADYITLDEALAQKLASITEVSESASVPELRFINSGGKSVFLLDGEELIGAKQNRIINLSIMVAAGRILVVPVSCVERGRWHHRSREFSASPRAHFSEGRAMKMAQVNESMKISGSRFSDQNQVWNHIGQKLDRFEASSPTAAMSDMFEQQAVRLEDYVRSFKPAADQVGAMFAIEGKVVGLDLFDSPDTWRKLSPKLLRSYGLDALDRAGSDPKKKSSPAVPAKEKAATFLRKVCKAKEEDYPALGQGQDIRLTGPGCTGGALIVDGRLVHLSAFSVKQ